MRFRVHADPREFRPVQVEITLESQKELEEFYWRMAAYNRELNRIIRSRCEERFTPSLSKTTCIKGINEFRKKLRNEF